MEARETAVAAEEREQDGAETIAGVGLVEVLLERHHGVDRAGGVNLVDAAADGFGHGHGIAMGAHEEVGEGSGRAVAGVDRGTGRG